jgi:transketolase
MVEKAKSGHPGGAMGGADFINILYTEFLNYDPSDMTWMNRDRFFSGPGTHVAHVVRNTISCWIITVWKTLKISVNGKYNARTP